MPDGTGFRTKNLALDWPVTPPYPTPTNHWPLTLPFCYLPTCSHPFYPSSNSRPTLTNTPPQVATSISLPPRLFPSTPTLHWPAHHQLLPPWSPPLLPASLLPLLLFVICRWSARAILRAIFVLPTHQYQHVSGISSTYGAITNFAAHDMWNDPFIVIQSLNFNYHCFNVLDFIAFVSKWIWCWHIYWVCVAFILTFSGSVQAVGAHCSCALQKGKRGKFFSLSRPELVDHHKCCFFWLCVFFFQRKQAIILKCYLFSGFC